MFKLVDRCARLMAIVGGVVLTALIVLTCVSVLGRSLNTLGHSDLLKSVADGAAATLIAVGFGPVNGDFELVEAGVAFAIFSFLPICQLRSAHAVVDVFSSVLPTKAQEALTAFWEVVLMGVIVLITWRLFAGMMNKLDYGDTTFLLQFPIWWAYAASLVAAIVASLVALYCAAARILGLMTGRKFILSVGEIGH